MPELLLQIFQDRHLELSLLVEHLLLKLLDIPTCHRIFPDDKIKQGVSNAEAAATDGHPEPGRAEKQTKEGTSCTDRCWVQCQGMEKTCVPDSFLNREL